MTTPFLAGEVHGVRTWAIRPDAEGNPYLCAIANGTPWIPGRQMQATCLAGRRARRGGPHVHLPPAPNCGCGLYALHPWLSEAGLASMAARPPRSAVSGFVAASGRIEVHSKGLRAELMRPVALITPLRHTPEQLAAWRAVADRYGVDLLSFADADDYRSYCETELTPLSRETVEDLVVPSVELYLEVGSEVFLGDDGEPVAGSGYRLGAGEFPKAARAESIPPAAEVLKARGTSFRRDALQAKEFEPGREVALVPEPENSADPHAIGIWDRERRLQVGYVPREAARRVGAQLAAGRIKRSLVIWQWRGMRTGARSGLAVLLSLTDRVTFLADECGGGLVPLDPTQGPE